MKRALVLGIVLTLSAPVAPAGAWKSGCAVARPPKASFHNSSRRAMLSLAFTDISGCKKEDAFVVYYEGRRTSVPLSLIYGDWGCMGTRVNGSTCRVRIPLDDYNHDVDVDAALLQYWVHYPHVSGKEKTATYTFTCVRGTGALQHCTDV